ncbi:hypothetical protein KUV85_06895 [Nocardioides panacisoli]|uniref:hypothetical protein n=1 Tax=Nocardioides panacisoli TaxID=627624 RepID=UPI001C632827|nr:hypothetical protein [Nocardioides panacisoli]QYJ05401.1 hypothetical protein KUV85_06895 [Nocardioides panacisoli]
MLLLVSGASGVGKSTARLHARHLLPDTFDPVEFMMLTEIPPVPTVAWRQQQTEEVVRRSVDLAGEGRHVLFAGDPVPAGEVVAAPSADRVEVAVLLLDASAEAQTARLRAAGHPEELLDRHVAFADWLRRHATDPTCVPEAVTTDAWEEMRWDRWVGRGDLPGWEMTVFDTTDLTGEQVGRTVADWAQDAVAGRAPILRVA